MAVKKAAKKAAKKPAPKPAPALTGSQIEKELALAHKMLATAGSTLALMLATRRLSLSRLSEAAEKVHSCSAHMTRLLTLMHRGCSGAAPAPE